MLTLRRGVLIVALLIFATWGISTGFSFVACQVAKTQTEQTEKWSKNQNCTIYKAITENTFVDAVIWVSGENRVITISTAVIAIFTIVLVLVGSSQIKLARDEFNASHRPRIRIKHVWLKNEILDDESLTIELVFTNAGDMAARINKGGIGICLIASDVSLPPDLPYCEFPGVDMSSMGLDMPIDTHRIITHREAIDIRNGKMCLYCIGFIEYLDANSPPRFKRTNFVRVLTVPKVRRPDSDFYRFRPLDPIDPDYEYED